MFYSHSFLAKKSPLGTVWIAAHLERRIKKPQIDAVDIPSYAECIMFPEVPMSLRMSGHLLLGLVRIYSRKVNYVYQDCNRMQTDARMAVASTQVNFPADADRAPFDSVTLPETFELDKLDESHYCIDGPDNHQKDYEHITLTEQDYYVAFSINEDNRRNSLTPTETRNLGATPMDEDVLPPFGSGLDAIINPQIDFASSTDPGSNNQANGASNSPMEVGRKDVQDFKLGNHVDLPNDGNDVGSAQTTKSKDSLSPVPEIDMVPGVESLPSRSIAKAATVATAENSDIHHRRTPSLGLEFVPSPPAREQRAKRKKKQLFDDKIVLSNVEMKRQLEDTTKLVCKRRKLPCSSLDVWRYNRKCLKEQILNEPVLLRMCNTLKETFLRSFPHSSINSDQMEGVPSAANASKHYASTELDIESVEQIDMDKAPVQHIVIDPLPEQHQFGMHIEENITELMPSPLGEEGTPFNASTVGSTSDFRKEIDTEMMPTVESYSMADSVGLDREVNLFSLEEEALLNYTAQVPSVLRSVEEVRSLLKASMNSISRFSFAKDFDFLIASNDAPSGKPTVARLVVYLFLGQYFPLWEEVLIELLRYQNDQIDVPHAGYEENEVGTLSARTRAVAQYFRNHSPFEGPDNEPRVINLNTILEGKTRKQCARLFFESLVLKNYGMIDVRQEEAYGDILITPLDELLATKF